MTRFHVVVPARLASTRLPRKPLADIHGKPMIVRVAECAARSGATSIYIATDHPDIESAVERAGYNALLTRADHPSGSDRVMEVADRLGWSDQEIVVNLQGDEPLMPPALIERAVDNLNHDPDLGVTTLAHPCHPEDIDDPNVVKVVVNLTGRAMYFSRSPIPYARSASYESTPLRHVGLYAYRVWALRRFVSLEQTRYEKAESLEQLRLLENGIPLSVVVTPEPVPGGVDTASDLARVRDAWRDL